MVFLKCIKSGEYQRSPIRANPLKNGGAKLWAYGKSSYGCQVTEETGFFYHGNNNRVIGLARLFFLKGLGKDR